MTFPLAMMWLAANARNDLKMKVTILLMSYDIAANRPHQRCLKGIRKAAAHYVGRAP